MVVEEVIVHLVKGEDAIQDPFFYVCGRLLSQKRVLLPPFSVAISRIWGLKDRVRICEEEGGILVFQFKEQETKDHVLNGGPWFFNNSMLLLADYDGIQDLAEISLNSMEVWVAVKGLCMAMRNEHALTLIENSLGLFVQYDQAAL
ncbi:uncharacterized protein LOC112184339 [Rosa chinensis]|uniref:uncharacterized protein LOC112184339 n=1 Tax=Rosa chinensis TaxID=74649 RepID=UPI000D08912F|nr:uncharacterized protein LOC112184339 [Rosa chinensis]